MKHHDPWRGHFGSGVKVTRSLQLVISKTCLSQRMSKHVLVQIKSKVAAKVKVSGQTYRESYTQADVQTGGQTD